MSKRLLFICSRNRLRSPTAEALFANVDGLEVDSAGLSPDAEVQLSTEALEWADVVYVMEKSHLRKLRSRFSAHLSAKRVVCLNIPDKFAYMDPKLIHLLQTRVGEASLCRLGPL